MPSPLDADPTSAAPRSSPVLTTPRPAPPPRASAEGAPPVAVPDTPDVWALVRRAQEGDAEAFGSSTTTT